MTAAAISPLSSLVAARDVSLAYGPRRVLDGVAMTLAAGEVVGLIGPNGAGKTTLLRVLAGLAAPESGEIALFGRPMAAFGRAERARGVAYLAQNGTAHWAVTVETLVGLGRLPHGGPWKGTPSVAADRAAVARAFSDCDLAGLAGRPLNRLSGGERARALLARALAAEPRVLLADEPVAGLDPAHALDVMAVLRARAAAGAGVIAVLHDLTTAARHCDRLVLLAEGRVLAAGPPGAVLEDDVLARAYGVRVHRGTAEGLPFVVPVGRVDRPGEAL